MVTTDAKEGRAQDKQEVSAYYIWKTRHQRPNVGDVSIRNRNGASVSKGTRGQWSTG